MNPSFNTVRWSSAARIAWLALWLLIMTAAAQYPAAGAEKSAPADIARTAAQQCRAHARVSVCDDALRWNPSDPSLLVAMGDALVRVRRLADAIRAYQRAAVIAPQTPRLQEKIEAAQASEKNKPADRPGHERPGRDRPGRDAPGETDSGRRFSNSEPDTQTH